MKPMSQALKAFLANTYEYAYAEVYSITTRGGQHINMCGSDVDIILDSQVYYADGVSAPLLIGDGYPEVTEKIGTEVSTMQLDLAGAGFNINGLEFSVACVRGLLDGAYVTAYRLFMPTYGDTSLGAVVKFHGIVSDVEIVGRSVLTTVSSYTELLNTQWPRNVWQGGCLNTLGDANCGVNLGTYTTTSTVASGSSRTTVKTSLSGSTTHPYMYGTVTFTTGVLIGVSRSVRLDNIALGTLELSYALPVAPGVGDNFNLAMGCNKSYSNPDGCSKFTNTARFRGMPFIPEAEVGV